MPDAVVVEGDQAEETTPAVAAAHEAAVAEGATAVQAQMAAESAEEAQAAAAVALEAAQANAQTAEAVVQATAQAETSAASAGVSAEMVMDALKAQTVAINTLAEELKASRKAAAPPDKPSRPAPDREPDDGSGGTRWVRK